MFVPNKTFSFPCSNLLFGASSQPCVWSRGHRAHSTFLGLALIKEPGVFTSVFFGARVPSFTTVVNRESVIITIPIALGPPNSNFNN